MSQPSVAAFFNTRKRTAGDDITCAKNRRFTEQIQADETARKCSPVGTTSNPVLNAKHNDEISDLKGTVSTLLTRSGRTIKRIGIQQPDASPKKIAKVSETNFIQFNMKDSPPLSPYKKQSADTHPMQKANEETPKMECTKLENTTEDVERGLKTPTKQIIKGSGTTPIKHGELKNLVRKELKFDEVKTKISRSAKLQELKASLNRIQELEKARKEQEERNRRLREGMPATEPTKSSIVQLKEFDTIQLEVLTSPIKQFKTPTKLPPATPDKNELMSPRHTNVSKRVLFSPAKDGSPSKMVIPHAYQRFMNLAEKSKAGQLPLPYKYRHLLELFKGLDSVCAMFHNRKECITFKKLKPAVQRMLRKNFTEKHLAQIKQIYPEAFLFTQMKMRNYGSTSKSDYFQLVITPNVDAIPQDKQKLAQKIEEDNVLASAQSHSMNPHIMTERMQCLYGRLLQRVLIEHEKFLQSLDPPLSVSKEKVTRWHPDFDLENCPDIECAHLPQPPNVEKYSSARDILSTARNLFNCATPMERALERYEAKMKADQVTRKDFKNATKSNTETMGEEIPEATTSNNKAGKIVDAATKPTVPATNSAATPSATDVTSQLLKGVPQSLLEKIRAKQAAKALDAMTRRPSQDEEATNYSRLPDMVRHLRNVFITERKSVLTVEIIVKKIQNSFRTCLTPQEIENHLKLIVKELPKWASFHEVRKTMYLKITKEMDLNKIINQLEKIANEKSK